ncbi:MAG TPA: hypothetical protein VGJ70_12240, partial [Solirubrobacteraceae bacterium]
AVCATKTKIRPSSALVARSQAAVVAWGPVRREIGRVAAAFERTARVLAESAALAELHVAAQRRGRGVAVAVAFPIAGLIGWKVGGRVDAVGAALVGRALTGAGLGAVQWWAAEGALGRAAAWIGSSAVGYAVGLAAGAALVGFDTDLGSLAVMGLVSGAVLGGAHGLVLARQGRRALAVPWALANAGAPRARLDRDVRRRHQRRGPVHGVRRRRRGGVHAAQRRRARALHAHPNAGRLMDAVEEVVPPRRFAFPQGL